MLDVEADCYWCLCKLIAGIQDQYTYAQPGIQRAVFKIHELIGWVAERSRRWWRRIAGHVGQPCMGGLTIERRAGWCGYADRC